MTTYYITVYDYVPIVDTIVTSTMRNMAYFVSYSFDRENCTMTYTFMSQINHMSTVIQALKVNGIARFSVNGE